MEAQGWSIVTLDNADQFVLKLIRAKQEILQGFLAPWVKAFEEWVLFAPPSLHLELTS